MDHEHMGATLAHSMVVGHLRMLAHQQHKECCAHDDRPVSSPSRLTQRSIAACVVAGIPSPPRAEAQRPQRGEIFFDTAVLYCAGGQVHHSSFFSCILRAFDIVPHVVRAGRARRGSHAEAEGRRARGAVQRPAPCAAGSGSRGGVDV